MALRALPLATAKLLSRWADRGWLSRIRRGLYVPVPIESRAADPAVPDPWVLAARLFDPCYIGGWSASEYWGLTEQLFRTIAVFSTKLLRKRSLAVKGTQFRVRSIRANLLFGLQPVWRGQVKVAVSDPSRTMVDLLSDPALGGGIRPTADILEAYLGSDKKDLSKLLSYANRLGNGAVFKRLGFLLERMAPSEEDSIEACRVRLSKGNAMLDPSLTADKLVTRWRLWVPQNLRAYQSRGRSARKVQR